MQKKSNNLRHYAQFLRNTYSSIYIYARLIRVYLSNMLQMVKIVAMRIEIALLSIKRLLIICRILVMYVPLQP